MNNKRNNWTQIEIPGDDTGNDVTSFELNLNEDEVEDKPNLNKNNREEEDLLDVRQESQDHRRPILTVQKDSQNKNNQARSESEEDQEERTVQNRKTRELNDSNDEDSENNKRNSRAHKRIQTLLAREREVHAELARERAEKAELRKQLALTQRRSAETSRDSFKTQLDSAESELEKAIQDNDAPRIAKLTKAIADATMKYNAYQAVSEEIEEPEEENNQPGPVQQVPEAAKTWLKRNPKFLNDRTFHVNARLISEDLSKEGIYDPNEDEYWDELDKRLRKVIKIEPDQSESERKQPKRSSPINSRNDEDSEDFSQINQQFKRQGNRVQVTPTAEDYDISQKFNIDMKDLMREKYKYAQQGYKGYVEIDVPGQSK